MKKYTITLTRSAEGFLSKNSLATDALNAIESIYGTKNVEISEKSTSEVKISYEWEGAEKVWIEKELLKHGVEMKPEK